MERLPPIETEDTGDRRTKLHQTSKASWLQYPSNNSLGHCYLLLSVCSSAKLYALVACFPAASYHNCISEYGRPISLPRRLSPYKNASATGVSISDQYGVLRHHELRVYFGIVSNTWPWEFNFFEVVQTPYHIVRLSDLLWIILGASASPTNLPDMEPSPPRGSTIYIFFVPGGRHKHVHRKRLKTTYNLQHPCHTRS
ncbi:hypothetical protein EJ04DRAFT_27035 [Polyplosphaeria fusca]|uniref:Uncharacterized protein n=1 Tax=Polyplosphaeria fusca TaxID=682080 RepID=A0A9P4R830_9PLEO|nr:hypothetical protein EJ04DRAFT_27035 [Polyplosphaeria fusca]